MAGRKVFQDSVVPIPTDQGITPQGMIVAAAQPQHLDDPMTLHFSLELSSEARERLESAVARGEVVDPKDLGELTKGQDQRKSELSNWLKSQGFEITSESPFSAGLYARAKASQIEKSLDVKMVRVTRDGLTYTAAQNAPSLPDDVGRFVHDIVGLQPFRHAHKHFRRRCPLEGNRAGLAPNTNGVTGPVANTQNSPPYLVSEIMQAYGAAGLPVTGKGQVIAILIDTFPNDADIKAFWKHNGIKGSIKRIQKVNVKEGQLAPPEGEETLDVSWASGIASGATVRVYASGSLQFVDLDLALDRILADSQSIPGLKQVSISLGLGEKFMGGPDGEAKTENQKFLLLASQGVNVFVSSGDAGSNPDGTGHSSGGPLQAEYESSDPCVVGVGGTTLVVGAGGAVTSETAWASSGGGKSILFSRPVWQQGAGVPAGTERLVPDVSLAADPDQGAFLVLNGSTQQIGGTSWSAPVWAAFCALINEARAKAGKPHLPFLNPLLYPLAGTNALRDVVSGSNGAYNAGPGYDLVTGLGVPNVKELIAALS